ncbi:hypothetical protein PHSY_006447 [Pseudozyma hubeiensis SY62]|uniref:Uncharacterized protein n=1 Tax=Pseudozyma hubeiensis (strain SY62) TaxID=1305764 RepID=R9PCB6_PSEHS|nr:hypothetical protein PHSY_006447 [Pseudozyma hubeiensis SY62]GAC98852.1 hypothetical protein PHSY_006447 [Pseudozyma hubeiensis SY62]
MAVLTSSSIPSGSQSGSSSHDSGPSTVPFRASSVPKSRKEKAASAAQHPSPSPTASSYSTWLLLDADEHALPFLRTFHPSSSKQRRLANGASSPAARSSEKLTESTNTASTRSASASSKVRSQASKYEHGLASSSAASEVVDNEKDRRMSLQNQGSSATSSGKRGFMSRLRAAGGSVSGAHVFQPPSTAMTTSGSWSIVEPPAHIKELPDVRGPTRTVHLAFTTCADENAVVQANGLVGRASSLLPPSPTSVQTVSNETVHSTRLDVAGLASLVSTTNVEAIYIGSARSTSGKEAMRPYLDALLAPASTTLKLVIFEPTVVRQLTPEDASALYDAAQRRNIALLLPTRWTSLWTTSVEETLLGLEILQDLHEERDQGQEASGSSTANGDADVSVDKSFDVSMSNIPTGLSGEGLGQAAELGTLRTQIEQLKRDLASRERRNLELAKHIEQQDKELQEHKTKTEALESRLKPVSSALAEPTTPSRSAAAASQAVTPDTQTQSGAVPVRDAAAITDRTPSSQLNPTPATHLASGSSPSPSLPVPSTSQQLAAAIASPSDTTSAATDPSLAPAAPITPDLSSPSRLPVSPHSPTASPNSSRSSSKVIASLTNELSETKALLEATRVALNTVRTQSASYQAAADEMRSTLSRARLENDSSVTILARKDRQVSEALERARKAEGEAKELGRASREWGTRIREVEEELGKERMKRSRAEQQYETLGSEWKVARSRLIEEVRQLREEHRKAVDGLKDEYAKVLVFKQDLVKESSLLTTSSEGDTVVAPTKLISQLSQLNDQMTSYINSQLQPLLTQLTKFEKRENTEVIQKLQYLTDELTRIKTLMRRGDITDAKQVPPGPL